MVRLLLALILAMACLRVDAQDIEPRRWAQMPSGLNFIGIGLNYSEGDIALDPVLNIENAEVQLAGGGVSYIRSFGLAGRSARVDFLLPYASGRWEGLLNGELTSVRRRGLGDPHIRLSMLLYGGPAQSPAEFASTPQSSTAVGVALSVALPYGDYINDRLINLGNNRWVVRPQLGVTHNRGPWSWELTGSVYVYGDNDRFYLGSLLETDPLWALQAHMIYTFRPGLWTSFSTAYGWGGESQVNGVDKNAEVGNWLTSLSLGLPLSRTQGLKVSLLHGVTQRPTGLDVDSLIVGWSMMF